MNFLSHSVIAGALFDEAALHFGAMLPDFAALLGVRLESTSSPAVARGLELHYRTDEVFHACASFQVGVTQGYAALRALGVRKGPSRALAHVGIELYLDTLLGQSPKHRESYIKALQVGQALVSADQLQLRGGAPNSSLLELLSRLLRLAQDPMDASPAALARRLYFTLERHPRLAVGVDERLPVAAWVETLPERFSPLLPGLWYELARGLGVSELSL